MIGPIKSKISLQCPNLNSASSVQIRNLAPASQPIRWKTKSNLALVAPVMTSYSPYFALPEFFLARFFGPAWPSLSLGFRLVLGHQIDKCSIPARQMQISLVYKSVINILLVTGFLSASRRPHMLRLFGLVNAAGQEKSKPFMKKQNLLRYLHLPFPPPTSKVYRHVGHVYPDCPVGSTGVWNLPDWM